MKQYKTSTGQDLPKVINWLANKEHERLKKPCRDYGDELVGAFTWIDSNVFNGDNHKIWEEINNNNFQPFYDQFPICKNSKGQILPDDIQIEIIEERLRQVDKREGAKGTDFGFFWAKSVKGNDYWLEIRNYSDYPTQSDEFTQGEIVEVSNDGFFTSEYLEFVFYDNKNGYYICCNDGSDMDYNYIGYLQCRKIQPTEYTIDQLIEKVSKAEGKPVKLKV